MSGKQAKKLRQLYRKDMGKHAAQQAAEIETRIKEYTAKLNEILKPPPKWIPEFIWLGLQRIFLNI